MTTEQRTRPLTKVVAAGVAGAMAGSAVASMHAAGAKVSGATAEAATPAAAIPDQRQPTWGQTMYAVGRSGVCGLSSSGPLVRGLQADLWNLGFLGSTADIDGSFGPRTESATRQLQSFLDVGVDGCAGYKTWQHAQVLLVQLGLPSCQEDLTCTYQFAHGAAKSSRPVLWELQRAEDRKDFGGWHFRDPGNGRFYTTATSFFAYNCLGTYYPVQSGTNTRPCGQGW